MCSVHAYSIAQSRIKSKHMFDFYIEKVWYNGIDRTER